MKPAVTVSVGIPAYNEEANIQHLLQDIFNQDDRSFTLLEVMVVLDKCTDRTKDKILGFHDHRIVVVENKKRLGQARSQNKILKRFRGDILVLLNADIHLSKFYIKNLIKPFSGNSSVGLTSGRIEPLPAKSLVESIINIGTEFKNRTFESFRNGSNIYMCHGRGRAMSREFAKQFAWPKLVAEDAYTYLKALELGFQFCYVTEAILWYRSPSTLMDHFKQSIRFHHSHEELRKFITHSLVESAHYLPYVPILTVLSKYLFKHPIYLLLYLVIFMVSKVIQKPWGKPKVLWSPSVSSKVLK